MIKTLIATFVLTILYNTSLFAQEIDSITYEKWVDFVNCKYTEAYFDKKIDDAGISQLFRRDYNDRVKNSLADVDFENANARVKMLTSLKSYKNGKILIDFIESKKADFDRNWDNARLIEHLLVLPTDQPANENGGFDALLSAQRDTLKLYLQKQLLPQNTEIQPVVPDSQQMDTTVVQAVINIQNAQKQTGSNKTFPFKWAIFVLCIIILVVLFFILKKKISNYITQIKFRIAANTEKIVDKDLPAKITQLEQENQALTDKIFHISYKNDELRREIDKVCNERNLLNQQIRELQNIENSK